MTRLCGADEEIVRLESDKGRLKIAEQYGVTGQIGDAEEWAKATDGLGADCIIDAAGIRATLKIAVDLVRPNGQISKVGWGKNPLDFSLDPMVQKNVTLQGSFSHNWIRWEKALMQMPSEWWDGSP